MNLRDTPSLFQDELEAFGICFDFVRGNLFVIHDGEQGLDDDGMLPGYQQNIVEYSLEGDAGLVDFAVVGFGAGIQFGPDFPLVLHQNIQALLHIGFVKHGRVGNQDDFDFIEAVIFFDLADGMTGLEKTAFRGWLSITTESDVIQAPQLWWNLCEHAVFKKLTIHHALNQMFQLGFHDGIVVFGEVASIRAAIDLTVEAIEVTAAVW